MFGLKGPPPQNRRDAGRRRPIAFARALPPSRSHVGVARSRGGRVRPRSPAPARERLLPHGPVVQRQACQDVRVGRYAD